MAHKYKFQFVDGVDSETRAQFPEFLEAGPVTTSAKLADIQRQVGSEYEVIEDEHDYLVHVRKSSKPRKAA